MPDAYTTPSPMLRHTMRMSSHTSEAGWSRRLLSLLILDGPRHSSEYIQCHNRAFEGLHTRILHCHGGAEHHGPKDPIQAIRILLAMQYKFMDDSIWILSIPIAKDMQFGGLI